MPAVDGLPTIIDAAELWLRERDYAGVDPFDALSGRTAAGRARPRTGRLRQAVIQAVKRSPVDLRPLLGVPPRRIAKALGLVASGYAALDEAGWGGPARERAQALLEWLEQARVPASGSRAWGYEFDVQTRWAFYPAGTPNIIVTTFVANAFLDWYERDGEEAHLDGGRRGGGVPRRAPPRGPRRAAGYFGYVPGVTSLIHNANVLGCGLLARARGPHAAGGTG